MAWKRYVTGGLLLFAALMVVLDPAHSPIMILMLLAGTERRLRHVWNAARGTTLRGRYSGRPWPLDWVWRPRPWR